jgi:hypothetical protein
MKSAESNIHQCGMKFHSEMSESRIHKVTPAESEIDNEKFES